MAVLEVFTMISGIELDFGELQDQARDMQQKLREILSQVEQAMQQQADTESEEAESYDVEEPRLSREDEQRIEQQFVQAQQDRSTAYELKGLLDRLDVFSDYEDRFLDLFKNTE